MANRPILKNIMNATLSSIRAMPLKDSSSDNSSVFASDRAQYYRTYDSTAASSNKKWMGNRDASDIARRRRTNEVALGTFNANNETMSFVTKETLTTSRALQRVRSAGAIVPPKVSKKITYYAPSSPTDVQIVSIGDGSLTISFVATTGNDDITGYKYTLDEGITYSSIFTESPFTISGLINGDTYQIRVVSVNIAGNSDLSIYVSGTPSTVPEPPTIISSSTTSTSISVDFVEGSDGGSTITNYAYSIDGTNFTVRSPENTTSPITINDLSVGTEYTIYIRAINENGYSTSASISVSTDATVPVAPTNLVVSTDDETLTISFTQASDGGSAITNYSYSIDEGAIYNDFSPEITSSPVTITNLTNGQEYIVLLRAKNTIGYSNDSSSISGTPNIITDMLRYNLSENQSAYESASTGSWVKISASEYSNLYYNITSSTKVASTDEILSAATTPGVTYSSSAFVANHIDTSQLAIPASSYLYAVAINWASKTSTNQTGVYINNTTANYSGFSLVGGYLPDIIGGSSSTTVVATNYYVFKDPLDITTTNGGILGFFSGIDNVDSLASGGLIGIVNRTEAAITRPGQGFHYEVNLSSEPTSSTVMTGSLTGVDNYAIGMQGLSTTSKQW